MILPMFQMFLEGPATVATFMLLAMALLALALVLWASIDCAQRSFKNPLEKPVWLLVILAGLPPLGSIVYLAVKHSEFAEEPVSEFTPEPPSGVDPGEK